MLGCPGHPLTFLPPYILTGLLGGEGDVGGLQALRTLDQIELDGGTFGQRAEALGLNGREVNENVLATLSGDEAIAFCVVEPLHRAAAAHILLNLLCRRTNA